MIQNSSHILLKGQNYIDGLIQKNVLSISLICCHFSIIEKNIRSSVLSCQENSLTWKYLCRIRLLNNMMSDVGETQTRTYERCQFSLESSSTLPKCFSHLKNQLFDRCKP